MANTFLRSGTLESVLALGENGHPLWHSALQIRETLRLREQQTLANIFAIPQPNQAGNRLDWYAPFTGKIIAWNIASKSERAKTLRQLELAETTLRELVKNALAASRPGHKLFGALLSKSLHFPDQNCVFIVDDKPVITFWGFTALHRKIADPIDILRSSLCDSEPSLINNLAQPKKPALENQAVAVDTAMMTPTSDKTSPPGESDSRRIYHPPAKNQTDGSIVTTSYHDVQTDPRSVPNRKGESQWRRYRWILPGLGLIALLVFQLRGCMTSKSIASSAGMSQAPAVSSKQSSSAQSPQPQVNEMAALPATWMHSIASLPLNAADVAQSQPQTAVTVADADKAVAPSSSTENRRMTTAKTTFAKNDLILPANAVRLGTTKFLNGNWRAILISKKPMTKKPPVLRYHFINGKGSVKLMQNDGTQCRVAVFAGLMKSGNLVINSRSKAICSNGARYAIPELTCKQGETGPAQCTARYDKATAYSITIKREGK